MAGGSSGCLGADDEGGAGSACAKATLFVTTTLMGSLCWVLTKVLVLELETRFSDGGAGGGGLVLKARSSHLFVTTVERQ
jgi:hypothetical protein